MGALLAALVVYRWPESHTAPSVAPIAAPKPEIRQTAPTPTAEAKPAGPAVPSFDIVRVTPEGSAVIAGRASPGAQVIVRDGERELGETRADQRGEFVLVPNAKLAPGGRELTLSARAGQGAPEVKAADSVVILVPSPPSAPAQPPSSAVAVLVPKEAGPTRLMQGPSPADRSSKLALNSVDYDEHGEIRFAGSAKPSTPVRVYVDNHPVGESKTDAQGQWTLTPQQSVSPGMHRFRVDQLAPTGKVVSRVELPFQRQSPPAEISDQRVVVQPGQNLWRIARHAYGAGIRYTVIYLANRDQIRDPKLIYPGQIFATPTP